MISWPKLCSPLIESIPNQIFPKRIPTSLHTTGRAQSTIPLSQDHKHRWTLGREQRKQMKNWYSLARASLLIYFTFTFTFRKSYKIQLILVICFVWTLTFTIFTCLAKMRWGRGVCVQCLLWKFFREKQRTLIASLTFSWIYPLGPPCKLLVNAALLWQVT